jgi:hypothetical protein
MNRRSGEGQQNAAALSLHTSPFSRASRTKLGCRGMNWRSGEGQQNAAALSLHTSPFSRA